MRFDAMARPRSRADLRHDPPGTLPNELSVRCVTNSDRPGRRRPAEEANGELHSTAEGAAGAEEFSHGASRSPGQGVLCRCREAHSAAGMDSSHPGRSLG